MVSGRYQRHLLTEFTTTIHESLFLALLVAAVIDLEVADAIAGYDQHQHGYQD